MGSTTFSAGADSSFFSSAIGAVSSVAGVESTGFDSVAAGVSVLLSTGFGASTAELVVSGCVDEVTGSVAGVVSATGLVVVVVLFC